MTSKGMKTFFLTAFILSLSVCKLPNFDLELSETLGGVPADTYTYTVTFDNRGAETPADPATKTVIPPAKTIDALPSEPARVGYTFGGWWIGEDGGGERFTETTVVTASVTVYARWIALPLYTVTYDDNGADGGGPPEDPENYLAGETVIVQGNTGSPALFKAAYTFIGWNTRADGLGTERIPGTSFTMPAENLTLFAVWTLEPTYTVTYSGNGSTAGMTPTDGNNYLSGQTVTVLPSSADLRGPVLQDGITQRYLRWNTQADGLGTNYTAGDTFPMPAGGVTLYAIWTDDASALTKIGPAGGLVFIDKGSVTDGWRYMEAAPADTEIPIIQWGALGTQSGAVGTAIGLGRQNTNTLEIVLTELFETGRAAQAAFDLTHNGFSDWFLPTFEELTEIYTVLKQVGLGDFADGAYWSSTEIDANTAYGIDLTTYAPLAVSKDSAYTVRAVRAFRGTAETYTVLYRGNGSTGGAVPEDLYFYEDGENCTVLNTGSLIRIGHNFSRWNTTAAGLGTDYNPGVYTMAAADLVLYAQWIPVEYYIYFNANGATGGTPPATIGPVHYDDFITVPENTGGLYRTGNTFNSFNDDPGGSGTHYECFSPFDMPANDITLFAEWGPPFDIGTGTAIDPYNVTTAEQLNNVRLYPDAFFRQMDNIFLDTTPWNSGAGWEPLGTMVQPFTGTYDGNFYTITGLTISRNEDYVGLFGYMTEGTLNNIHLENANINNGGNYSGILLGHQYSTVAIGFIENCSAAGTLNATGADTGGLVGYFHFGEINTSYSLANVTGADRTGGLIGQLNRIDMTNAGKINSCFSTGTVFGIGVAHTGGLVGLNRGYIYDSYSTGDVDSGSADYTGGFAGENNYCIERAYSVGAVIGTGLEIGSFTGDFSGPVMNECYYNSETAVQGGDGSGLTTVEMTSSGSFTGFDFGSVWTINEGTSYPYLQWQTGNIPLP